jgi:hypothetical protein
LTDGRRPFLRETGGAGKHSRLACQTRLLGGKIGLVDPENLFMAIMTFTNPRSARQERLCGSRQPYANRVETTRKASAGNLEKTLVGGLP